MIEKILELFIIVFGLICGVVITVFGIVWGIIELIIGFILMISIAAFGAFMMAAGIVLSCIMYPFVSLYKKITKGSEK